MAGLDVFGKANREREVVHQAFIRHCRALSDDTSKVVRDRQHIVKAAGMDLEDAAKQETLFCVAMFGNTTPTLYWMIWELFSHPDLLQDVRREIAKHAVTRKPNSDEGDGPVENVLDIAALKTQCPLLFAVFQETQRVHHVHANIRKVTADTFLDDGRYLLRQGNYLQMAGSPIHHDEGLWGPTAKVFDPRRFLPVSRSGSDAAQQPGSKRPCVPPPTGFLAWGTPPHLCPARQFAATEIMITVALLAMQCDLVPVAGRGGEWPKNPALRYSDVAAVLGPNKEFEVQVRPGAGAGRWAVEMGTSKTQLNLLSG